MERVVERGVKGVLKMGLFSLTFERVERVENVIIVRMVEVDS